MRPNIQLCKNATTEISKIVHNRISQKKRYEKKKTIKLHPRIKFGKPADRNLKKK